MKKLITLIAAIFFIAALVSCTGVRYESANTAFSSQYLEELEDGTVYISLGKTISVTGAGVVVDGSRIAIGAAGTYLISGTLDDGQMIVDAGDTDTVKLILSGVNITCSDNAPIYVDNAEKVILNLADGTENVITDGDSYILGDDDASAAIFSKDDLTINGNGSLAVNANYNNGIQSKDDLKITGGTVTVNAVNDGLKGRDSITIRDAAITLNTGGDGMQSNNDENTEKGTVTIESGTIAITAGSDGIQAETDLIISGGDITISTGGGSANGASHTGGAGGFPGMNRGNMSTTQSTDTTSSTPGAQGLKAGDEITITGGTFSIDSSDDCINSNNGLTISGGDLALASGDDGLHSDSSLTINDGEVTISQSYEGIESKVITINGGNIHLVSSDDGINVSSGGGDMPMGGMRMQNEFAASADNYLAINGGYLFVDAQGDGIDVNGPVTMTGGIVIVNGPTNSGNGAMDYTGSFKVTGGLLVAAGSAGMAMAPGQTSTQYSVMINSEEAQPANTLFHIETDDGRDILTFMPTKTYQSVVLCSPELKKGTSYLVYSGGNSSGKATDGLYTDGIYTAGTQIESFTISDIVTTTGANSGGMGGSPGGAGGMIPGGRPGR